jgi:D-alanyl-D-alanine carboxypeptidase
MWEHFGGCFLGTDAAIADEDIEITGFAERQSSPDARGSEVPSVAIEYSFLLDNNFAQFAKRPLDRPIDIQIPGDPIPFYDLLSAATRGRGVASVAVIPRRGASTQVRWTPQSEQEPAFLAYSITKTFTAALILEGCEQGALRLDDRLAKWFPRISRADRITLRQLLNHTAGIPDYGGLRSYHESLKAEPATPWSFERYAAETFDRGLSFQPGQGWAYSNPGYMLLKRVIEDVTGTSFRGLVAARIARPLGLRRTFVAESTDDLKELALGTSNVLSPEGSPRDVRTHYHPGWVSHGVVASTASDLVAFVDGLFRGELLSSHSLDEMTRLVPVTRASGPPSEQTVRSRRGTPSYGLGLMGDPASPWGLIVGHNGGGPCYSASVFHAVDLDGATVCAMGAIEDDFSTEDLVFEVLDRLASRNETVAD